MNLPVKYREVIYLFYFEELAIKEIAELLGINPEYDKNKIEKG